MYVEAEYNKVFHLHFFFRVLPLDPSFDVDVGGGGNDL
jgi:hypothetical protein